MDNQYVQLDDVTLDETGRAYVPCVVESMDFGRAPKKRTPRIEAKFRFPTCENKILRWDGYLTDKAWAANTKRSLGVLGFDGNMLQLYDFVAERRYAGASGVFACVTQYELNGVMRAQISGLYREGERDTFEPAPAADPSAGLSMDRAAYLAMLDSQDETPGAGNIAAAIRPLAPEAAPPTDDPDLPF